VCISQSLKNKDNRIDIIKTFKLLGCDPKIRKSSIDVNDKDLAMYCSQFGKSLQKWVPQEIKDATPQQIRIFLNTFCKGDGYDRDAGRKIYYTSSKQMADDLQELIFKSGGVASISKRKIKGQIKWIKDHYAVSSADGYIVAEYARYDNVRVKKQNLKKINYDGMVYCLKVKPHHTLFVRRNGHAMWCGNCGVERAIYDASEGILTSENTYVLLIGNPTDPTSAFFDKFQPDSGFHTITVSSFDTPNVKHKRLIYPALCKPTWPEEKEKQWGKDSPMYQARVEGQFPVEGADVLIPLRYTLAALNKWEEISTQKEEVEQYVLNCIACDVARKGDDRTVIGLKFVKDEDKEETREVIFTIVEDCVKLKTTETSGLLKEWCDRIKDRDVSIKVDDIGVGGGVVDQLEDDGYNVIPVNNAESPTEVDTDMLFLNLRAQCYWRVREDFLDGKIAINDEELASELSKITWKPTRQRKIQIESKEDIKERIGKSPDKADCVALSYAEYPAPSLRWLN
jgi:hypothetical protein